MFVRCFEFERTGRCTRRGCRFPHTAGNNLVMGRLADAGIDETNPNFKEEYYAVWTKISGRAIANNPALSTQSYPVWMCDEARTSGECKCEPQCVNTEIKRLEEVGFLPKPQSKERSKAAQKPRFKGDPQIFCRQFNTGTCPRGDNCRWAHVDPSSEEGKALLSAKKDQETVKEEARQEKAARRRMKNRGGPRPNPSSAAGRRKPSRAPKRGVRWTHQTRPGGHPSTAHTHAHTQIFALCRSKTHTHTTRCPPPSHCRRRAAKNVPQVASTPLRRNASAAEVLLTTGRIINRIARVLNMMTPKFGEWAQVGAVSCTCRSQPPPPDMTQGGQPSADEDTFGKIAKLSQKAQGSCYPCCHRG
jgi:hypothetical protein